MADRRRDLEHRLHQLGVDARLERPLVGHAGEYRVDVLHEVPRLGIEQHVLLLDAERVRVARAEAVVEDAAHWISASASSSTSQCASRNPLTTMYVLAGLISPNTSPCARPTSSRNCGPVV